jgi:hypothetical protein
VFTPLVLLKQAALFRGTAYPDNLVALFMKLQVDRVAPRKGIAAY